MYTMEEMERAYDAYCAEMDYEDFTPYDLQGVHGRAKDRGLLAC